MHILVRSKRSGVFIGVLLVACLLIGSCGSKPKPIIVGAKNSPDQMILGEIIAQYIEARLNRPVERRLGAGNTLVTFQSMQSNQISLYPEYTGTIITEILREQPAQEPSLVFERARGEMRRVAQVEVLDPLGFSASPVGVIATSDSRAGKVSNLSDAAEVKDGWKIAVSYDFQQRLDGVPAITEYHFPMTAPLRAVEGADLYRTIEQGQVSLIFGNTTDGQLTTGKWKELPDDKKLFSPQQACILVRQAALDADPMLKGVLSGLSGKFPLEKIRQLNAEVVVNHRQIADVAKGFLATLK